MCYYINVLERSTIYAEVVVTLERMLCLRKVACLSQPLGTKLTQKGFISLFYIAKNSKIYVFYTHCHKYLL